MILFNLRTVGQTVIFFGSQQRTDGQFRRITEPVGYLFQRQLLVLLPMLIFLFYIVLLYSRCFYQLYFHLNLKEYSVELFTLGNNYSSNVYSTILVLQKIELILELNDYLRK